MFKSFWVTHTPTIANEPYFIAMHGRRKTTITLVMTMIMMANMTMTTPMTTITMTMTRTMTRTLKMKVIIIPMRIITTISCITSIIRPIIRIVPVIAVRRAMIKQ